MMLGLLLSVLYTTQRFCAGSHTEPSYRQSQNTARLLKLISFTLAIPNSKRSYQIPGLQEGREERRSDSPRMRKPMFITHTPNAIATTTRFLFQMAILVSSVSS